MKECLRCHQKQEETEFYVRTNGNAVSTCRACVRQQKAEYRAANREKTRVHNRAYKARHSVRLMAAQKIERSSDGTKHAAHNRVARAIKSGRLLKLNSCQRCGNSVCSIEASHDDYSRPLVVEWLCIPCHRKKDMNKSKVKQPAAQPEKSP